ncbi:MAG: hypothetical protein WC372_03185 [Candidatus Neomarinimicrobiota bacterium]
MIPAKYSENVIGITAKISACRMEKKLFIFPEKPGDADERKNLSVLSGAV